MGIHPLNMTLRLFLEMGTLFAYGYWGWTQHDGIWRFIWALGLIIAAAVIWGTFAVPDDPSRSGKAPVPVPGIVRLILELVFFAAGVWAFYAAGRPIWGLTLGILTIIHYGISYDRNLWLLKR